MRRSGPAHGGGRVLDLRHLAPAQRGQRYRPRAHPPRGRYRRRKRVLGAGGEGTPAYGGHRRLVAAEGRAGRGRAGGVSLRNGQRAGGDEPVGTQHPSGAAVQRCAPAPQSAGHGPDRRALRARLARPVGRAWRCRERTRRLPRAAGAVPGRDPRTQPGGVARERARLVRRAQRDGRPRTARPTTAERGALRTSACRRRRWPCSARSRRSGSAWPRRRCPSRRPSPTCPSRDPCSARRSGRCARTSAR